MAKSEPLTIVWLRRDLRLYDHAALYHALLKPGLIQPLFIFDADILARFSNKEDRRLGFIAEALADIHVQLKKRGGGLLVLHGSPTILWPRISEALAFEYVIAAEDYEPETQLRDENVKRLLPTGTSFTLVKDHVIFSPLEIFNQQKNPFKVFTPYARAWREALAPISSQAYEIQDKSRYADYVNLKNTLYEKGLTLLDPEKGAEGMLSEIGYVHKLDPIWPVKEGQKRLHTFISERSADYKTARDFMAENGTSRLSPYVRFGLVSLRECVEFARKRRADTWLSELIWREFYMMVLYHAPDSAKNEWNPNYRGTLDWSRDKEHLAAFCLGKTGYPIVDAAMRQLLAEGWMHNRARMIVASFCTKHLQLDWRWGEEHFAQYLMDYEMSSNVGGWQWAASTGTDAQPYFRVFNPTLQSQKFDPNGDYIRRYVPELSDVSAKDIHEPWQKAMPANYPLPIVDHAKARISAIAMFKKATATH